MSTLKRCLRSSPHSCEEELLAGGDVDPPNLAAGVIDPPAIISCSAAFSFSVSIGGWGGWGSKGVPRVGSDWRPAEAEVVACECECRR